MSETASLQRGFFVIQSDRLSGVPPQIGKNELKQAKKEDETMKVCNSEAMKKIRELEEKKRLIVRAEETRSRVSYREGEEMRKTRYDYAAARREIGEIDGEIRRIKHALAKANCETVLDGFGFTLGEALVCLAQYNAEYARLSELSSYEKLSRRITANGVLEYTECLYDPEEAERDQEKLYAEICRLQVAIDRANLTNLVEI